MRCLMNNVRRKKLKDAVTLLSRASEIVSDARSQEEDCLDNMPENLQMSDRYEDMEKAVDCLEDAETSIDDAISKIEEAM